MSKTSDFYDWKRHSITEVVMQELKLRVNQLTEKLITEAGADPSGNARDAGRIEAYKDILNIRPEDIEGEDS